MTEVSIEESVILTIGDKKLKLKPVRLLTDPLEFSLIDKSDGGTEREFSFAVESVFDAKSDKVK